MGNDSYNGSSIFNEDIKECKNFCGDNYEVSPIFYEESNVNDSVK